MKIIVIFTLALSILLTGCYSVGRKIDPKKVDQIQKGKTTRAEVLKLIGSPDQMTKSGDGKVIFQYNYIMATAKAQSYIPVVGLFAGGANVKNQTVMITFDEAGVVSDVVSTYGATETGMGASSSTGQKLGEVENSKRDK